MAPALCQPRRCPAGLRTHVRQLRSPCPGAGGLLLRAALSGQTSRPTPHRLCGHVSNKPKALSLTGGCPPRPHGHNTWHSRILRSHLRIPGSLHPPISRTFFPTERQPFPVLFRGRARVSRAHRTDQFRLTSSPSWTNTPSVLSPPTTSSPLSPLLPSLPPLFLSLSRGKMVGQFPHPYLGQVDTLSLFHLVGTAISSLPPPLD